MIHITLTCCLVAASLAAPQGRYQSAAAGYSSRNSVVQGSALPRRFSVSKSSSESRKYLPVPSSGSGQYQGGGTSQYKSSESQYQGGASQYRGGSSQYQGGSSQYQGGVSQYQGGASQYQGTGSQYQGAGATRSQYGGNGGQYGGGNQYKSVGTQYAEDPYAEPANYDFSYEVSAPEYSVQFGHQESRRDMAAKGSYTVLLPDGRTQLVEYEADQEGYRPTVTYQETAGGRGGYNGGAGGYNGGAGGYNGGAGGYGQQGYSGAGKGANGYGQNGNGHGAKGNGAGKTSYGQKGYGSQGYGDSGSVVVSGGYQVSDQGQGYKY